MTRFRAQVVPGEELTVGPRTLKVRGGVLLRQWDEEDQTHYYWEEWQIAGLDDPDSWLEFDHYLDEVCLYQPVYFVDALNPELLRPRARFALPDDEGNLNQIFVEEVGVGEVVAVAGETDRHLTAGDELAYAALRCYVGGIESEVSAERYGQRDYLAYTKLRLDLAQQHEVFGRQIASFGLD